jgi:uncharacterized phage protein (TIGR02218 family)
VKSASTAAQAILAAGEYLKAELYQITLATGASYYFTDFDIPLTAAIYPSGTSYTYQTGLTIERGTLTQAVGLDVKEMELTLTPQGDSPNAPILIAGYSLLQAARLGLLDSATVTMSKLFMNYPVLAATLDTSPGGVLWYVGRVNEIDLNRLSLTLKVNSRLELLTVQMPRNTWQTGCVHSVYDAGCTLLKSAFTVSGTVGTSPNASQFNTSLTQADHWFEMGVLTFTSGVNNGFSAAVKTYLHSGGAISLRLPFPATPSAGDTFTVYPGCDGQQATCSGKFSNLAHYRGYPYIPVPETTLDGGTSNPPLQTPGSQAGAIIGAPASAARVPASPFYI